jgi:hypothetical protein
MILLPRLRSQENLPSHWNAGEEGLRDMTKSSKATSKAAHKKAVPTVPDLPKITTTIRREWLCEIAAGRKQVEYRKEKPYWTRRLSEVKAPFLLRLINGMQPNAPELTALVSRARKNSRSGEYELHLDRVIVFRHWNLRLEQPAEEAISKRRTAKVGMDG